MTLDGLIAVLRASPNLAIQITLPDGSSVPAHFPVTEVGRVQKEFIDCGGTIRNSASCVLQVWVADDVSHRLNTSKLAKIIGKWTELFGSADIPLEVEYDNGVISQYPVLDSKLTPKILTLNLGAKHTTCLAQDHCGVRLDVLSGCSTPGCC